MSVGNRNVTMQVLPVPFCVVGLKAGDEIVEINKKAAEDLDSALLKDALVQPSLCLTVRTYPEIEEGQKLTQPPPRRLENPSDLSDSTLAFTGSNQGIEFNVEITRRRHSCLKCSGIIPVLPACNFHAGSERNYSLSALGR